MLKQRGEKTTFSYFAETFEKGEIISPYGLSLIRERYLQDNDKSQHKIPELRRNRCRRESDHYSR